MGEWQAVVLVLLKLSLYWAMRQEWNLVENWGGAAVVAPSAHVVEQHAVGVS